MISQFFEVQIKEGQINRYLDLAASLKPSLEAMVAVFSSTGSRA